MKKNIKFLNELYKNTQMGILAINGCKKYINNETLLDLLEKQKNIYLMHNSKIQKSIKSINSKPAKLNPYLKSVCLFGIKSKLMFNKSTIKICNMLVNGTQMGINNTNQALIKNRNCEKQFVEIANEILKDQNYFITSINNIAFKSCNKSQ